MYDDVESDFWKEIFVHLLHKNMVSSGADRLTPANCKAVFDDFSRRNPKLKVTASISASYATWEVFVTPTIKLRLFIQNQIKASLLQADGNDFVKIADAKFPNNPFPEIEEFLGKRDFYQKVLEDKKQESLCNEKKQKILYQFIKAHLIKKFCDDGETIWTLEQKGQNFILNLQKGKNQKSLELTAENYQQAILNLSTTSC